MRRVYKIALRYKIIPTSRDYFNFVETVVVNPEEDIDDVIIALKERLYYAWEDAPIIEGVTYHLLNEIK